MAIELLTLNKSITTLVSHLTNYYGEDATLETYVICVRVRGTDLPGGTGLNWVVGPNGHGRAGGLLKEVLKALEEEESSNGDGNGSAS